MVSKELLSMSKKKALTIATILSFLMYVLLTVMFMNGLILNLQGYIDFKIIPIVFWGFIILLNLVFTMADIGFLKIAAFMGIFIAAFIILFQMVNNTSEFELIDSGDYELIVQRINSPDTGFVIVYKKTGPLFSKTIESIQVPHYYELNFEIVDEILIMNKCTKVSCIPVEIELE